MKRMICKFANWLLRRCTNPTIAFKDEVYINGRTYKFVKATHEIFPYGNGIITFEVTEDLSNGRI